jgi:hypothetical protein
VVHPVRICCINCNCHPKKVRSAIEARPILFRHSDFMLFTSPNHNPTELTNTKWHIIIKRTLSTKFLLIVHEFDGVAPDDKVSIPYARRFVPRENPSLGRSKKINFPKTAILLRKKCQVWEVLISGTTLPPRDFPRSPEPRHPIGHRGYDRAPTLRPPIGTPHPVCARCSSHDGQTKQF